MESRNPCVYFDPRVLMQRVKLSTPQKGYLPRLATNSSIVINRIC